MIASAQCYGSIWLLAGLRCQQTAQCFSVKQLTSFLICFAKLTWEKSRGGFFLLLVQQKSKHREQMYQVKMQASREQHLESLRLPVQLNPPTHGVQTKSTAACSDRKLLFLLSNWKTWLAIRKCPNNSYVNVFMSFMTVFQTWMVFQCTLWGR